MLLSLFNNHYICNLFNLKADDNRKIVEYRKEKDG